MVVPYVVVADDAFALKPYIMKPYSFRQMAIPQRVFNYRLSRARRIIENVFGICRARFRILGKPIDAGIGKSVKIVLAICALHNFLMTKSRVYTNAKDFDNENERGELIEGAWRAQNFIWHEVQSNNGRGSDSAIQVREKFTNYFVGPGEVGWQYVAVAGGYNNLT